MSMQERKRRRGARLLRKEQGQATVEYAIVLGALITVVGALGALWRVMDDGTLIDHALSAASHHLLLSASGVIDVFLY